MIEKHKVPDAASRLRRARMVDRLARRLISAGGMGVLAAVIAIFVFIAYEVVPLLGSAEVDAKDSFAGAQGVLAVDVDEYLTAATTVAADGVIRTIPFATGAPGAERAGIVAGASHSLPA
jgi:phosphate transport system permease protein